MLQNAFGIVVFIGFPILIVTVAIIVLIRVFFMPALINSGERKKKLITTTKVISKRENLVGAGHGASTFYYILFEDSLELRVSENIYKKVNAGDIVKLSYIGEKLDEISILKKSNEKSDIKFSNTGYFTDNDKSYQ